MRSIDFEIYNRWGELVFQSNDSQAGWNGRIRNHGPKAPPGIYSYVLIANVKSGNYDHVEKGSINLIR
ncbi:MAG: gliding motility-associated C-terminal domain-containing protein [Owenweeksia sp.]|nr:gliding motility-associated C-terminal domain-containing protein [Owenweeksia sp.]